MAKLLVTFANIISKNNMLNKNTIIMILYSSTILDTVVPTITCVFGNNISG